MTGLVIFRDEQGREATYRYTDDESGDAWVSIAERICRRLGIEESQSDKRRWPAVRAAARERAKEWRGYA